MPYKIKPIDRDQVMFCTLDSLVGKESIARIIDAFVENIDLSKLEFKKFKSAQTGRSSYDPASLLKLYIYGYRKNIRSSRKLAEACEANIDIMWMLGGLKPDFRTIADFRKENIKCLKGVFKEFTKRVTVDIKTGFVSIDGSKFKAWNSKDANFTITKLDDRIKWLEDKSEEYLRQLDSADKSDDSEGNFTKEELEAKLAEIKERQERYESYRKYMEENNLSQMSLTDPEAKLMKNKNGMDVSYNIQTAVDSETHLILDYCETNQVTDHGLMAPTAETLKMESETIVEVVADKGYDQAKDMIACLEKGIIPNVVLPDGKDEYNLEIEYREAEDADASSILPSEIKKCLHSGKIPKAYEKVIKEMEVVEVRRKIKGNGSEKIESPYASEEEMRARARNGYYVRDPERDLVICPNEEILRKKSIKKNWTTRYANKHACSKCPYRNKCVSDKGITKWKEIDFNKDILEKKAKWWDDGPNNDGTKKKRGVKSKFEKIKVVRFKLHPDREKMDKRKNISEHPFGTIKRAMGASYFLLKGKRKIGGETALFSLGYNLSRAENMFKFEDLIRKVSIA